MPQWQKSMGRWWLGPMIEPLAIVTVIRRGNAMYEVFPMSPDPIVKRGIATSTKAMAEAEAVIAEWSVEP